VTDDEWRDIADRMDSTWPTAPGATAEYRDDLDHLRPAAVEKAIDELLIEYRTEPPPARVLRARAEEVAPDVGTPFEPSVWDDDEPSVPTSEPRRRDPETSEPPPRQSRTATVALILGMAGLFTVPLLVSTAAILVARRALAEIEADPGLGGAQRARTGRLLGWIGLSVMATVIVVGVLASR
jgi:hypothetical protein